MKYNEGTYSFGLYSVWELQANNSLFTKSFDGLQLPCYAINWHGIMHAYTSINGLYTCQVSDVSLVKQASSSGLKLSQF